MRIDNSVEDLEKCSYNEAIYISWDVDKLSKNDFFSFYNTLLGKLRHGGKLLLTGTSLSLFCKYILNGDIEKADRIEDAKYFHEIHNIENIVRQQLVIENIWIEEEKFNIVGVRR